MKKAVETENLSFSYNGVPVLDKINLTIFQGDFAGLTGANGTGKSTLLKLLLGLISPAEGSIRLLGEDIRAFKQWPKIGYVPQNTLSSDGSFPATAEEIVKANLYSQIGLMRLPKKRHLEQALQALETVGMTDCARKLIGNLSGGQQQRVMIARTLVNEPEIMLLDEPTAGIDAQSVDSLYELFSRLNKSKGITIIMVTHDIEKVSRHAGRIFSLDKKQMTEVVPNTKRI